MNRQSVRIALVTAGLPFGGSTTFLLHLASGLRALGVPCEIFSLTNANPFAPDFAAAEIPVHLQDEDCLILEDRLAETYRELADFKPTAVIANIGHEAYGILHYLPSGVARIGIVHDLAMKPHDLLPPHRDALDRVVVVGAHLLPVIQTLAENVPCVHLAHGIPLPEQIPPRDPNPSDVLKIIYFGRLIEGKGARIFPVIVDELHQRRIPFRWTIHGSGSEETYLRDRLAPEIASGEVVLSTPVARDQLFSLIRKHDVYIMASDVEGGPLTLLEAMSLGLVPVCSDIPCLVQEVIHDGNGYRVSRSRPGDYADVLARLHQNRALLERMSAAARKTITTNYTVEAMASRYLNFLKSNWPVISEPVWSKEIKSGELKAVGNRWYLVPAFRPLRRAAKKFGWLIRSTKDSA